MLCQSWRIARRQLGRIKLHTFPVYSLQEARNVARERVDLNPELCTRFLSEIAQTLRDLAPAGSNWYIWTFGASLRTPRAFRCLISESYSSPNLRNTDIENKYQTEPKGKNRKCCHSKLTLTEHGQKLTKVVSIKKTPFYLSYLSVGIFRPDGSKTRFLTSFEFRRRSNWVVW